MANTNQRRHRAHLVKVNNDILSKKVHDYNVKNIKEYKVRSEDELLNFLFKTITDTSKNNIKSLLSKHLIGVNGLCVTQFNYTVYQGDIVQLSKTPFTRMAQKEVKSKAFKLDIVYEDNDFLVINKPSGLLAVESDKEKTITAYKLVLEYMQRKGSNLRVHQVHRIDKDTSGILLFTKSYELKELLKKDWNKLVTKREYLAIVEGSLEEKKGTITSYLKETSTHVMYDSKQAEGSLKAITNYKVLQENKNYSLVDVFLETGRKNQIRVAFSSIDHPVVGDEKYGHKNPSISRLGLHHLSLELINPLNDKLYSFKTQAPSDFRKLFK